MSEPLVILGASARAAAFSALRAGLLPWSADLFADADLARRCPARRVSNYPHGLVEAAFDAPAGPWMYTGALENHPDLVDHIAATRPLLGNPGEVLRQVRNPWLVREALLAEGLPCPMLHTQRAHLPPGRWLRKPLHSAGGARIELLEISDRSHSEHEPPGDLTAASRYYQQYIEGTPFSGVFIAAGGGAFLLGVTRQWVGAPWCGARGFQYAGSLGPVALSAVKRQAWERLGNCLARRFSLVGLVGVDVVINAQGIYPVEVNPRYTASVEVLERGLNIAALTLHMAACREGRLPQLRLPATTRFFGKAILYARADGRGSEPFWQFVERSDHDAPWPVAADLPHRGEPLLAGRPALTLFADGTSEAEVEQRLQHQAKQVFALLDEKSFGLNAL